MNQIDFLSELLSLSSKIDGKPRIAIDCGFREFEVIITAEWWLGCGKYRYQLAVDTTVRSTRFEPESFSDYYSTLANKALNRKLKEEKTF